MTSTALFQARTAVAQQLGLSGFELQDSDAQRTAYRNLTPAMQIQFTDALAAYISQNPGAFSAAQVTVATDRVQSAYYNTPLADTSYTAAASEFFSDWGSNLMKLANTLFWLALGGLVIWLIFTASIARQNIRAEK